MVLGGSRREALDELLLVLGGGLRAMSTLLCDRRLCELDTDKASSWSPPPPLCKEARLTFLEFDGRGKGEKDRGVDPTLPPILSMLDRLTGVFGSSAGEVGCGWTIP